MVKVKPPVVELTLPVLPDMELAATKTAEVVSKHMGLNDDQAAEINMALIEACINAFEHSESDKQIEIHFKIKDDLLEIQVTDKGIGFDKSKVAIPKIEEKLGSDYKRGQLIAKKGTIILPNHILALKTLGVKKVMVKKKINILFFSTGNEV